MNNAYRITMQLRSLYQYAPFLLSGLLRMSLRGSIVILILLPVRLLLRKAPKRTVCALWLIVLFRLLCPVSIVSPVSAVPNLPPVSVDAAYQAFDRLPSIDLELPADRAETAVYEPGVAVSVRHEIPAWLYLAALWGAGFLTMALRGLISYGKLRRALRTAVPIEDNVYLADGIASPFTLGLFHPKIYLPAGLSEAETACILLHERCHVRNLDTLWKLLGYLALCMHWFDPLVWLACALAGRDMELRCDEAVLRTMGDGIRADYARSVLSFAAGLRPETVFPAFGGGDPKARIRNIARWRKPRFGNVAASVLVCLALFACLLPDAKAVSKADSILCLGKNSFNTVDYALRLGNEVHSGELSLELWQDGQRLSVGGMTVSENTENLHIELAMDGGSGLVHATIADDGATYETDVHLPVTPMSWAVGSCEENVRFAVQPGGEYILAALYYNVSAEARVQYLDCEALTQEPNRIREVGNVLLLRLTLSGEAEWPVTDSGC